MININIEDIMRKRARFISFEGTEGSGKSTQAKKLCDYLNDIGIKAIYTREIGGTDEAEKIRDIIVNNELLTESELMLIMAARIEHVNKVIIPALKNNIWVICDRFIDSTACYQSYESSLSIDDIYHMHRKYVFDIDMLIEKKETNSNYKHKIIMPDITFFLDSKPEISLNRAKDRGDNNKFEEKDIKFHKHVYETFHAIIKKYKDRIVKIDIDNQLIDDIHYKIIKAIFLNKLNINIL